MSRSCADSLRCVTRSASCVSFGQSFSSQSHKIGNIDKTNAIQTAARGLIGTSKRGSAKAKISMKKDPQRACQTAREYVAEKSQRTTSGVVRSLSRLLLILIQIKNGETRSR